MTRCHILCLIIFSTVSVHIMAECGCKSMQKCYFDMVKELAEEDETKCIEGASIGASTITVFLKALTEYCPLLVKVTTEHKTFDGRNLYEVVIQKDPEDSNDRPTIIIEAGQEAGTPPVRLALYVIEQLLSCSENIEMIEKARWVILPSTNPDGQEFSRYRSSEYSSWKKNCKSSFDNMTVGVDITRNFNTQWNSCPKVENGFSNIYPGPAADSEEETVFINSVIEKYKEHAKVYLSIKRDGHHIGYPFAFNEIDPKNKEQLKQVAAEVAAKVNQRSSIHVFTNGSIYAIQGDAQCGHSVDAAFHAGIPLAFEMRVFIGSATRIMTKYQTLPQGFETTLRNGYFNGIKELFNAVTNEKKYGKIIK